MYMLLITLIYVQTLGSELHTTIYIAFYSLLFMETTHKVQQQLSAFAVGFQHHVRNSCHFFLSTFPLENNKSKFMVKTYSAPDNDVQASTYVYFNYRAVGIPFISPPLNLVLPSAFQIQYMFSSVKNMVLHCETTLRCPIQALSAMTSSQEMTAGRATTHKGGS